MKKKQVVWISVLGILLLFGGGVFYFRYHQFKPDEAPAQPLKSSNDTGVGVSVVKVGSQTIDDTLAAVGSTVSNESVNVTSEISGKISRILFSDGAMVSEGKVLFELDASTQLAEIQQAKAHVDLAKINAKRTRELAEKNFVSKSALDEANYNLKMKQADLALAQAHYEKTLIRAPFSGIVGLRNVSVGDYVNPGDVLVNLEDIASLRIDFQVPELYLSKLKVGQTISIFTDAFPEETFSAKLEAIDPKIQENGRSFLLRARMPNPNFRLKPGMFVRISLLFGERENILMVPEQAIVSIGTD